MTKGSNRLVISKQTGKPFPVPDNDNLVNWTGTCRALWINKYGTKKMDGPVTVKITSHFERGKGHYGTGKNKGKLKPTAPIYYTKTPDVDKIARAVLDALNKVAFRDDRQVIDLVVKKYWDYTDTYTCITIKEIA